MTDEALPSLLKVLDRVLDHKNVNCFFNSNKRRYRSTTSFLCISCFSSSNGELRCRECFFLQNNLEIQSLHENVIFLSHFLEDFPKEGSSLEARLTNAAKQGRDALSFYKYSFYDNDPKWQELRQELEKSIKEIDSIYQEARGIKNSNKNASLLPRVASIGKETTVGLEEDLIQIKGRLCGEPSQLGIIPIIGMGGIGKTTLARYTYQDPSNIHHFDVRAWATVSQTSSAKIILSSLLSSMNPSNKNKYQWMNMEDLVVHGHRYLKKRRYLIVMDDLWDTNVWDDVRMAFPDDCNGSRIIITTRNLNVASYVDSSSNHHKIELMSGYQSWRLLKVKVFGHQNCPPELENIGKHISDKCKGLPLAIVVIAGVLSKLERNQDSWEKIARNLSEAVNTSNDKQFSDILSLSYIHLPPHLRPCFLYTACFPEDYVIDVSRLIRLWAAEGFILSDGTKDLEELGYEYLEELSRRNLVLIAKESYDGKIKAVKIHDVLRDLCKRQCQLENFLCIINEFEGNFPQDIENSHRLSICSNVWGCIPNMDFTLIHTLVIVSGHWALDYWKHFRFLRVLDAITLELHPSVVLASEITEIIHLRYLALGFELPGKTSRFEIPELVSKLKELQTFIMRFRGNHKGYAYLPVASWRMQQIRHVILPIGILPDPSSKDYQEALPLVNLHTLRRIKNFTCSEWILKMLPNIKNLGICYRGWDIDKTGWPNYGLNNLVHLACLEELSIHVYHSHSKSNITQKNLAFPVNLKRLTLSGCHFQWEEMSNIGKLPNLEVLKLKKEAFCGSIWETTEGEFCQLKLLQIESTDLHQWITESSHFPRLERLTLYECSSLQEIPFDIGEISTLELIEVDGRDLPVVQSAIGIQEEQQSFDNDIQVSLLARRWKW